MSAEQRGEDLERFVPTADADFERLDDHELKSTELELLRSFYLDALAAKVRPNRAWAAVARLVHSRRRSPLTNVPRKSRIGSYTR